MGMTNRLTPACRKAATIPVSRSTPEASKPVGFVQNNDGRAWPGWLPGQRTCVRRRQIVGCPRLKPITRPAPGQIDASRTLSESHPRFWAQRPLLPVRWRTAGRPLWNTYTRLESCHSAGGRPTSDEIVPPAGAAGR
jgi:hypothetical protein